MNEKNTKLIFVYNADSGVFNLLGDMAHKMFSPKTYQCSLCALTHGNFGMRREFSDYLKTLPEPFEFLHADEFQKQYDFKNTRLPAVFRRDADQTKLIISAETINRCSSLDDLKQLINSRIQT